LQACDHDQFAEWRNPGELEDSIGKRNGRQGFGGEHGDSCRTRGIGELPPIAGAPGFREHAGQMTPD
jgi:hypothetical protein